MPYIKPEQRHKFQEGIDKICAALNTSVEFSSGELNYVVSSIVWRMFNNKRGYTRANELVGVLECVKQEFIRRQLNPYEDDKIEENGDI